VTAPPDWYLLYVGPLGVQLYELCGMPAEYRSASVAALWLTPLTSLKYAPADDELYIETDALCVELLLPGIDDTTTLHPVPLLAHCHSEALVTPLLVVYASDTVHVPPAVPVHTAFAAEVSVPEGVAPGTKGQVLFEELYTYCPPDTLGLEQLGYVPGQFAGHVVVVTQAVCPAFAVVPPGHVVHGVYPDAEYVLPVQAVPASQ
jgi:hypothetical protein